DGVQACRCRDGLDHIAFDVGERLPELLPVPSRAGWAGGLPGSGIVVGEVSGVSVLERQGAVAHPGEGVKGGLAAFGYLGRHECSPFWVSKRLLLFPVSGSPEACLDWAR